MSMERLSELRSQVERARQEMKDAAKGLLKEGSAEIFEKYGDIVHSFGWRQYTPYFNDGDACEFSVYDLFVIANADLDNSEDEDYISDWEYEGSPAFSSYGHESRVSDRYGEIDERYAEAKQACESLYSAIATEDLAKDIFGDHVKVIFTSDGVHTEEYDHD